MPEPPTLSVCCLTRDPAPQVATALAALRPYAGEVVLALDARLPPGEVRRFSGLADRIFRVQLPSWPEQVMSLLHQQCSGRWILRLDADELCEQAFLDSLPELLDAQDVAQYWLPRRWLFPDPDHWLDEWPWTPDYQCRLYRNDPLLWFSGRLHTNADLVFPCRYLRNGLIHLDALWTDRPRRNAKLERYEAWLADGNSPLQATEMRRLYFPEDHMKLPPQPLAQADRPAVAGLLATAKRHRLRRPMFGASAQPPLISAEQVLRSWPGRTLQETDYDCLLEPVDTYRWLRAGDRRPFRVRVHNRGAARWPGAPERQPLILLGTRWRDAAGAALPGEEVRVPLLHGLEPGDSGVMSGWLDAPKLLGSYTVEFELIHEHVRWFGRPSERVPMRIEPDDLSPL